MNCTPGKAQLLIVDDDPSNLELLDRTLSEEDFDILVADNGSMALALVHTENPDLMLVDVTMPVMDGFELCRRLKSDPAHEHLPVIFMTAHDQPRHRIHAFQVGGLDYIPKPFEPAELLARLKVHLSIRSLTKAVQERNIQLEAEIQQRQEAEAAREALTRQLVQRTEELHHAKQRLEQELAERERDEAARAVLTEQIIRVQEERLAELSTPLVPITDHIVAMPLVGTMDLARAERVMEAALKGVASRAVAFVILDITGVRKLDAAVAQMLVRIGRGLGLLGARTIITGVSPQVAKAWVENAVTLDALVTRATLQDGIAYAMQASRAAGSAGRPV